MRFFLSLSNFNHTDKMSVKVIWHNKCITIGQNKQDLLTKITYKIMNVKPLADRVLVKPVEAEEKTVGGIIIPDSAKEKPLQGNVLAVGSGTKDEQMVLKVGDRVLYGKYAGTELELDGEKFLIMRQNDILAVIE